MAFKIISRQGVPYHVASGMPPTRVLPSSNAHEVEVVTLSDDDLERAAILFGATMPWPIDLLPPPPLANRTYLERSVTWFGDHARFIVANWET